MEAVGGGDRPGDAGGAVTERDRPHIDGRPVVPPRAGDDVVAVGQSAVTPPRPTSSPAVVPWRLLVVVTAPVMPVVPAPNVTAPTLVVAPLSQSGLRDDVVAVGQARSPRRCRHRRWGWCRTRLLVVVTGAGDAGGAVTRT